LSRPYLKFEKVAGMQILKPNHTTPYVDFLRVTEFTFEVRLHLQMLTEAAAFIKSNNLLDSIYLYKFGDPEFS